MQSTNRGYVAFVLFYSSLPGYVLNKDDLHRALIVLRKAIEAYPGREE